MHLDRKNALRPYVLLWACVGLTMGTYGPAHGQEIALDGIVISGEKIDRSYLDTTTSVGVATQEDIETYSIDSVFESFNRMANVRHFPTRGGNSAFQIRGLNANGISEIGNAVPLVSVIIDGATQNREGILRGSRSTWDMRQIEVLRGPQSSLYGRAALAGAVVIESNDPTYHWEAAFKAAGASHEYREGGLMLSGPLIDKQLAFRISGEWLRAENDIHYTDPLNDELGDDELTNLRGKLLFEPQAIPGLSALFTFSSVRDKPASTSVDGNFFDRVFDGGSGAGPPFSSLFTEFRETEVDNYIANVSYELGAGYTLRSVSAFIDTKLNVSSPPANSAIYLREDSRTGEDFTQDLRIEIDDKTRGLSGVVGAFYGDFSELNDSTIIADIGLGNDPPIPVGLTAPVQLGQFANDTETTAVYADLKYNVFGPWSIIGGLRYQKDKVRNFSDSAQLVGLDFSTFPPAPTPIYISNNYDVENTFDVWLPKGGLAYQIDNTQTVSATASRGYRQGYAENIFGTPVINTVNPEFVWTYELAYRLVSEDKRLTFGTNLFYNDYSDQQITIFARDGSIPFTNSVNAGSSHSYGAEFEATYDFGNGLRVFGSLGLLKTEIDELAIPAGLGAVCGGGSCNGNDFPEAPSVTFAFGGVYKHSSGLFVAADASYTGSYYSVGEIDNRKAFEVDKFFVANAKVGYEFGPYTAAVFAKNIFDEEYLVGISGTNAPTSAAIGDSRLIGVELRGKF